MRSLRAVLLAALFSALTPHLLAQTYSTGFEPPAFTVGDVNGQNSWGYLSNSPTRGAVELTPPRSPAALGLQTLAVRTNNVGFFGVANHLYSATINPPAGETGSTAGGVLA